MILSLFMFSCNVCVGNLGAGLGLPWALAGIGAASVPMSHFGKDWLLQPWADCPASTSELIGEDSLGSH